MAFFFQFRSKLAITHTIAIKWKEKCDAVVVDCHHSLRFCVDQMKMSLPKIRETPTSPWVRFRVKFRPTGTVKMCHSAIWFFSMQNLLIIICFCQNSLITSNPHSAIWYVFRAKFTNHKILGPLFANL